MKDGGIYVMQKVDGGKDVPVVKRFDAVWQAGAFILEHPGTYLHIELKPFEPRHQEVKARP